MYFEKNETPHLGYEDCLDPVTSNTGVSQHTAPAPALREAMLFEG